MTTETRLTPPTSRSEVQHANHLTTAPSQLASLVNAIVLQLPLKAKLTKPTVCAPPQQGFLTKHTSIQTPLLRLTSYVFFLCVCVCVFSEQCCYHSKHNLTCSTAGVSLAEASEIFYKQITKKLDN